MQRPIAKDKTIFSTVISKKTRAALQEAADKSGRSASNMASYILEQYLREHKYMK